MIQQTCSIQEKWFTWLTVFLYDKIWKTTFQLPESLLFPALTYLMPFHITNSTRAVAGSSTIYDDIKTPCLRSLWTDYGIKVIGCFIFAETLLAGSPVAPIPPSHTTPPLRRRLDIIQEQYCTSYYGFSLLQEFT